MRVLLALTGIAVLAPLAVAGAVRTVTAPAPILAIGFDGPLIAYATGRSTRDCNRVFVWNLSTRAVSRLGRKTHCEETSTGNAIAAVSIAGRRIAWTHFVGGNVREWTLWTATPSRPSPLLLQRVSRDADEPAPIVLGSGDGGPLADLLPYAVDRQVIVLRSNGSRAFTWIAPARVTALGANGGRVVVGRADGGATILGSTGRLVRELDLSGLPILAAFSTGPGAAVQRGRELIVDDGRGRVRTFSLPAGSRLLDAEGSFGLYVSGNRIVRRISFAKGSERSYGAGAFAQLEPGRVAIGAARTVRLVPLARAG